jgi:hypothetical protein
MWSKPSRLIVAFGEGCRNALMSQAIMRLERFWGHLSEKPLHTKGSRLKSITKIDDDPNGIKLVESHFVIDS